MPTFTISRGQNRLPLRAGRCERSSVPDVVARYLAERRATPVNLVHHERTAPPTNPETTRHPCSSRRSPATLKLGGMKKRSFLVSFFALASCYATASAGCGGNDTAATSDDGGPDGTLADANGDTIAADTAPADVGSDRGQELTGQECTTANDCYTGLDAASLHGQVTCLDRVQNGYCTHVCTKDEDCCAVPGECRTGLRQVCAPFESTGAKYCFISCEAADIQTAQDAGIDAGPTPDDFCKREASNDFSCRSTGGGSANRKVCLPGGAPPGDGGSDATSPDAADAADADGG
jgi:hypothetical protein